MKGERTVTVDGKTWGYRVGVGNTVIVAPDGKKTIVKNHVLAGTTPSMFERGQYKHTRDGMVTPGHLYGYIANNLVKHPVCPHCGTKHHSDWMCPDDGEPPLVQEARKATHQRSR